MKLPDVIVQMAYAMMILSQSLENQNILKTLDIWKKIVQLTHYPKKLFLSQKTWLRNA